MKRIGALVACCAAVCLAVVLAGCSTSESYTPPEKTPVVTSPAIGKDGTLRVGVNTKNTPLAGMVSNKIVGLDVDIAAALADELGLKLEIIDVGTDPEGALADKKVDVVMGIDKSDSSTTFWTSEYYLPTAVAVFSTTPNAAVPTKAAAPKIAAQVSSKSAWAISNEFGEEALSASDDLKGAFAALQSGQVQYAAADAVIGTYAANSAGIDVSIVALMQQPGGYGIGVLDANTDLKTAVSEAVSKLTTNGVISIIETKWLGGPLDLANVPLTEGAVAPAKSTTTPTATTPAAGEPAAEGDAAGESAEGGDVAEAAGGNAVKPAA